MKQKSREAKKQKSRPRKELQNDPKVFLTKWHDLQPAPKLKPMRLVPKFKVQPQNSRPQPNFLF